MKPLLKTEILSVEVKPPSRPPPQSQLTVEPETLVEHFNTTIDDKDEEDDVEEDEVEDDEEEMEDDETSSLEGEEEMYDDFDVVLDHHNSHSVDEFLTEEEKEKRRQALALEQQQLILAHVQAGRAMREKQQLQHHQKQPAAAAKMVMELDIDDEAREQRHSHQTTRLPRTKGVAFRRFGNGSLRRVDRHGEPSLRLFKTPRRQEEKETGDEAKKDAAVIDKGMNNSVAIAPMETVQKEFIPAPIPKVSAWKLGPPPGIVPAVEQVKVAHPTLTPLPPPTVAEEASMGDVNPADDNEDEDEKKHGGGRGGGRGRSGGRLSGRGGRGGREAFSGRSRGRGGRGGRGSKHFPSSADHGGRGPSKFTKPRKDGTNGTIQTA